MTAKIKILIVDDHQILIDGLCTLLESHTLDFDVISATTITDAFALIDEHVDINIALLDLFFPGVDGFSFLKRGGTPFPVIVMSSTDDTKMISAALEQGASGFLSKGTSLNILIEAIQTVLAGETFVSPEVKSLLSLSVGDAETEKVAKRCKELGLTPQNLRVLRLIAEGLSNRQIAEKLFVSTETVKSHTKQIYSALQANNRLSSVNEARRIGLL